MRGPEQQLLTDALSYALEAHGEQTRKGKRVPYVSHLLQVAGLALEHGGDIEVAAAALLHDSLEDCEGVTPEELQGRFGTRVASLVEQCSDLLPGDTPQQKSHWKDRKDRYVAHLAEAEYATRLIAACDKLHNLRDLGADLRLRGLSIFEDFTASAAQTLWFYEQVRERLGDLPPALLAAFDDALDEIRAHIQ